jgi:predicted nuclease with TOPRIM domain
VRQLTKQRDQLRAELQSKRHPLPTSAAILSQHVIDLQSINQSDGVFQREELQEEAKVLYQEWKRLQDFNFQQRIAISNAQKELAELLRDEAVARFERQKGQISELQEKVKQYQHENAKLDRRVKELASERELEDEREIADLKKQIEEAKRATRVVEENIRKMKENRREGG